MQAAEGRLGRVFVLRLEDGDRIPDVIEAYAAEQGVSRAMCTMLGGLGGGMLVVGPEDPEADPIVPKTIPLPGVHEVAAVGTLFPDESGTPKLHMHLTAGRDTEVLMGCCRKGVTVWRIVEAVLVELVGVPMSRKVHPTFGFEVLEKDNAE